MGKQIRVLMDSMLEEEFKELILKKGIILFEGDNLSPVIEFSRTIIRNNPKEISRGRLWVENKYYNDREELINKSKNLDEWYSQLSEWKIIPFLPLFLSN